MSYDYGLFNLDEASISSFENITEGKIRKLKLSAQSVKEKISEILPSIVWGENPVYRNDNYGQIVDAEFGRFEVKLDLSIPLILISTSMHQDYKSIVLKISESLNLTAFDVQTGDRIYQQKPE